MTAHSALTGADLHELKGASTASTGTVPIADGAGSTAFAKVGASNINTSSIFSTNLYTVTIMMTDVSAPSSVYAVIPRASTLSKVYTTLQSAITVADSTVTVKNAGGLSAGTITVSQAGSAAGDVDSLTPVANNTFTAGQVCTITTDGASTTTAALFIVLELTQTA